MPKTLLSTDRLPDLGDTRTAFAHKSNSDLFKAYWLFRIIGTPWLTAAGASLTKLALALHLPIKGVIKATIFKQFCGGETVRESLFTAEKLAESGVGTILDYSVEGQDDEATLDETTEELLVGIRAANGQNKIPFAVFKVTGLARTELLEKVSSKDQLTLIETEEWKRVETRFARICKAGYDAGTPVLIDAEDSWTQQAIDDLTERQMALYNKQRAMIFNTLQLYRHDRLTFLKDSFQRAEQGGYHLGVKLVRGAYMEKERERAEEKGYPDPIQPDKAACDRDYDASLAFCVEHLDRMAVVAGTHNEKSTLYLAQLMQERDIALNDPRIWFSQLLGMSDNISFNMAAAGYNVVKYMPYGPVSKVLPYLIRRAIENTSARGQTGRELGLIIAERKRRGKI
ncbi:MAG: proline dehydrogenase family protein [Flavobacteriales bacterium]|nr:proline dehydrogenase family protein [Flavobacteriales bacterium]MBK6943541.1 proline dehydrogenase family protein [Flavobacteriales bacterium]MBK7240580.1 proline dehydrogenase family protein [Flavobacteriales bacterium]MBP9138892.1 proline dehydrogenase family protein [Flavobacteriales bacterium]HQV51746.1 proline dehydrogenase family protein [Flavobacteriales bacterium]